MVTAYYINPLKQFNTLDFDLVFGESKESQMFRFPKSFSKDVTDKELETEVQKTVSENELGIPVNETKKDTKKD